MSATERKRSFAPIFIATVTPDTIDTRQGKNGPYELMQGATIAPQGKASKKMTVMAFGKCREDVLDILRPGQPIEVAVQYDGGTLKIIGKPREKTA